MNQIQTAFKFNDTDLAVNRQGWATEQQVFRLGQRYGCGFAITGVIAVGLLGFACAIGVTAVASRFIFDQSVGSGGVAASMLSVTGMLIPLALGVGLLLFLTLILARLRRDRREKRVVRCTGLIKIESHFMETDSLSKTLHIDGRRFKIDPFQSRALRRHQGKPITVYYFPHSQQIASIEIAD
jgi:hypothetical protein